MSQSLRFTSADLEVMPDDGKRYEIVNGELYVSKQPDWNHQLLCTRLIVDLVQWNNATDAGAVNLAPGLIFADDDDVAPDLVWVSRARLRLVLGSDGKCHGAPDLVVELLSPGTSNEHRDRDVKLKLYSRRGVREYWIADWRTRSIEVYRREGSALQLAETLFEADSLRSPLLPGFMCPLARLFAGMSAT